MGVRRPCKSDELGPCHTSSLIRGRGGTTHKWSTPKGEQCGYLHDIAVLKSDQSGIPVNAEAPWTTDTPMMSAVDVGDADRRRWEGQMAKMTATSQIQHEVGGDSPLHERSIR
jgi:hypothetical protein